MENLKLLGSCAGILALIWNIFTAYYNRSGRLEVTLGWKTNTDDYSTYLTINVINKGVDTRVIGEVYVVYLDEKEEKNTRRSTESYIVLLPGQTLKRGDKLVEKIFYQKDPNLENLFLSRPLFFKVVDTFGKSYNSSKLNSGGFALPKKVN